MKRMRDQKGVALAAVVLAVVIVSVLSAVIVIASSSEVKQSAIQQKSTRAYYIAHSAVDALSGDVLKRVDNLRDQASLIRTSSDKAAYDAALADFFATCVPLSGSYTHTASVPNAFSSGSSYQVPVTVASTSTVSGSVTTLSVVFTASFSLEGRSGVCRVKMQLQTQTAANPVKITDSGIFSDPLVASQSISLGNYRSVGSSYQTVKGKSGMVTIQGLTDSAAILNQFGITVKDSSALAEYAAIVPGTTALSSNNINTNNGQYYSITGNFNRSLRITGTYGMDVYLIHNGTSFSFNGGGYFASNSGADVILIAPNATAITLTGNFLSSVPTGYNASGFYIFAPNATVSMSGSFNGMYGSVFAKSIDIPNFNYGSSNSQYVVNYRQLLPSTNPLWDISIGISYESVTAGSRVWID